MLLELNVHDPATRGVIGRYGVTSYPDFAVLAVDGAALLGPLNDEFWQGFFDRSAADTAAFLASYHHEHWARAGAVPASADVIIAQLSFLHAAGETHKAVDLIARALADRAVKPTELACLKAHRALELRRAGRLAEGLGLLQEIAPRLALREPSEEEAAGVAGLVAPFVVSRGEVALGVVSSAADARLVSNALTWLDGQEAGLPTPENLDGPDLASGALALSAVLNRPRDAARWLEALRARGDPLERPALVLATGLVLAAQGESTEAVQHLLSLVTDHPGASFAPLAGVLACEVARRAGESDLAARCAQMTTETFGRLLRPDLAARLQ